MAIHARRDDPSRMSAVYATKGATMRKGNFNGTAAEPTNMLCAYKDMDLSAIRYGKSVLDMQGKGSILVTQTRASGEKKFSLHVLDFSKAADITAVKPAEIITALNSAVPAIPDMQAVFSNATQSVNLMCTDPSVLFVEVFSLLAGALGFGGGEAFTSYGSFFQDFLTNDDTITVTPTNVTGESTAAELMGGYRNTRTAVMINGERGGVDYAVNVKAYSPLVKQFFEGGELVFGGAEDDFNYRYSPVNANRRPTGKIEFFNILPLHAKNGETDISTIEGLIVEHVYAGTPVMGDDTRGAVSLSSFNFTLQARIYRSAAGQEVEQPEEIGYKERSDFILALMKCIASPCLISQVEVEAATGITVEPKLSMPRASRNFVQCAVVPVTASGFNVAIAEKDGKLGATYTWNDDDQRVIITSGLTAGTDTVNITVTNVDGTQVTGSFELTVV